MRLKATGILNPASRPRIVALAALLVGIGVHSAGATSEVRVTISGVVTNGASGVGVAGMCVFAESDEQYSFTVGPAATTSTGAYSLTFTQSRSEVYYVFAQPGCGSGPIWQFTDHTPEITLTGAPESTSATGVNMQTWPAGTIRGRITDSLTGQPIIATVKAVASSAGPRSVSALTFHDGSYVISGAAAGQDKLFVSPNSDGYMSDWFHHQPTSSTGWLVSVPVGGSVILNESLPRANAISGQVTDAATGLPLKGIDVFFRQLSGQWVSSAAGYATTAVDGTYTLLDVGAGTFAVCFRDSFRDDPQDPSAGRHAARCYKNKAYDWSQATPISVSGFGVTRPGINQSLPLKKPL